LIAFHLNELIKTKQINHEKIKAFTLNFPGFEQNEFELVNGIRALIPFIEIQSIDIEYNEFILHFPEIFANQDVPVLSISHLMHTFALSKIKELGYTVLLNGQGADEVFGGYFPKDFNYLFWDLFKRDKMLAFKELIQFKKKWNISLAKVFVGLCESYSHFRHPRVFGLIKSKGLKGSEITVSQNRITSKFGSTSYARLRALEQVFRTQFNGILHYEDMSSMQNSIEIRSPFMDFRLIDIGLSLPAHFKVQEGYSKWLLREALGEVLPNHIGWATWKFGYNVPKKELYKKLDISLYGNYAERDLNRVWRGFNLEYLK
jgi:asparagine synthase (glutamine-hydrolysing)